jgi:hypothetical protein
MRWKELDCLDEARGDSIVSPYRVVRARSAPPATNVVTKLYNEEMQVVAPRTIQSLNDLEGKTVRGLDACPDVEYLLDRKHRAARRRL